MHKTENGKTPSPLQPLPQNPWMLFSITGMTLYSLITTNLLPARSPRGHPGRGGVGMLRAAVRGGVDIGRIPGRKGTKGQKRAHRAGPRPVAPWPAEVAAVPACAQPARPGAGRGRLGKGPPAGNRPMWSAARFPCPQPSPRCSRRAPHLAFRGRWGCAHGGPARERPHRAGGCAAGLLRAAEHREGMAGVGVTAVLPKPTPAEPSVSMGAKVRISKGLPQTRAGLVRS